MGRLRCPSRSANARTSSGVQSTTGTIDRAHPPAGPSRRSPMDTTPQLYAARLDIDYPDRLDRLTTLLRLIWIIPIVVIYSLLTATGNETVVNQTGQQV